MGAANGATFAAVTCGDVCASARIVAITADCFDVDGVDYESPLAAGRRMCLSNGTGEPVATPNLAKVGDCLTATDQAPIRRLACSDQAASRRVVAIFDTTGDTAQECANKAPAMREVLEWTVASVAGTGQPVVPDRRRAICLAPKA